MYYIKYKELGETKYLDDYELLKDTSYRYGMYDKLSGQNEINEKCLLFKNYAEAKNIGSLVGRTFSYSIVNDKNEVLYCESKD